MYQLSLCGVSRYHMGIAFIYHGFRKPCSVRCEIFPRVVTWVALSGEWGNIHGYDGDSCPHSVRSGQPVIETSTQTRLGNLILNAKSIKIEEDFKKWQVQNIFPSYPTYNLQETRLRKAYIFQGSIDSTVNTTWNANTMTLENNFDLSKDPTWRVSSFDLALVAESRLFGLLGILLTCDLS